MTAGGEPGLRWAVRALIVDPDRRVLLCRLVVADGLVVWATPGGGVEPGETATVALRRELREEVGLRLDADPPHVWRQVVRAPGHANGYDGVVNDYFLVRTAAFTPRGEFSDAQLAAECISDLVWWPITDIAAYTGSDLFSPRDLATPLTALLADGVPAVPIRLGL
jgi:8-oxo-dGTP diphosphatase